MPNIIKFVTGETSALENIAEQLIKAVLAIFSGIGNWNDDEETESAVVEVVDLVEAAQMEARRIAVAYQRNIQSAMGLTDFPSAEELGLDLESYPRWDITPVQVWERPVKLYRRKIKEGKSAEEAKNEALKRAESIARQDVKQAHNHQTSKVIEKTKDAIGWRRVIHPDLSETGVCGLCVAAADRVYSVSELMPLHNECKCTVAPVTKSSDPGLNLNTEDLKRLYQAAGGTNRKKLSNVRVKEYVSTELGPILTNTGKDAELAAAEKRNQATEEQAKKRSRTKTPEETIEHLELENKLYAEALAEHDIDQFTKKFYERKIKKNLEVIERLKLKVKAA